MDETLDEAKKILVEELSKVNQQQREEIDRLNGEALKNSIAFEKLKTQVNVLSGLLHEFLNDYEGAFDADGKPSSIEMAENFYLPAAKYMREHFGRGNHRIDSMQNWIDEQ